MKGLPTHTWENYFKESPPEKPVTILSAHFRNIYDGPSTTTDERHAILR